MCGVSGALTLMPGFLHVGRTAQGNVTTYLPDETGQLPVLFILKLKPGTLALNFVVVSVVSGVVFILETCTQYIPLN